MALRESAKHAGQDADLRLVTGLVDGDGGVEHGDFLVRMAEAVARWQWNDVARLREESVALMGEQPISDAILVASGFNGITRVADATGIRLKIKLLKYLTYQKICVLHALSYISRLITSRQTCYHLSWRRLNGKRAIWEMP